MRRFFLWLSPILSAALLWLSFHPADLGLLGWVAFVPLLVSAVRVLPHGRPWDENEAVIRRACRNVFVFWIVLFVYVFRMIEFRRILLPAWLAGWAFYAAGFYWLYHVAPVGPFLLAIYMGLYFALFALLFRILARRLPLALAAPLVWIALEYVRAHLLSGLPWFLVAYTQHELLTFIQCADLFGPWLVSGLVIAGNALVAKAVLLRSEGKVLMRDSEFRTSVTVAGLLITATTVYGWVRLGIEVEDGPRVVVIQPNIPQNVKTLSADPAKGDEIFQKHVEMTRRVCTDGKSRDLIVWPESVIYGGLLHDPSDGSFTGGHLKDDVLGLSQELHTPVLFGSEVADLDPADPNDFDRWTFTNSAILMDPVNEIAYRYNKMHLVVFSEKIPKLPLVEHFTEKYTGYSRLLSFRAGTEPRTFELARRHWGTAICFEAVFPEIPREFARKGCEVLVNISNEGWFRGSSELDQMMAMNRFRAVESRLAIVRGTNTGISAVIAPTGRTVAAVRGKETEGTLDVVVPVTKRGSLYMIVGDLLAWVACAGVAALLVWSLLTRPKPAIIVAR